MKELKETLKEFLSIFKHIPLFLLLAFLTVFHITLLSGEYSKAMENIFSFFYKTENNNIIELIRNFLANLITLGWVYYFRLKIKKTLYFKNINHPIPIEKLTELWAYKMYRVECFIWYLIAIRYAFDILKYHDKPLGQFITMASRGFSVQLIICLIAFVAALIINSRFTHQKS